MNHTISKGGFFADWYVMGGVSYIVIVRDKV